MNLELFVENIFWGIVYKNVYCHITLYEMIGIFQGLKRFVYASRMIYLPFLRM